MQPNKVIPEGQRTKVIYTLMKEQKYTDVSSHSLRQSTISIMNYSSALAVVRCPCLHTATTWVRTSSTLRECTSSLPSTIPMWLNTASTWLRVTIKMVTLIRLLRSLRGFRIRSVSRSLFCCNRWFDMSKTKFLMPRHCFDKVYVSSQRKWRRPRFGGQ